MKQVSKKLSSANLMTLIKCFMICCAIAAIGIAIDNVDNLKWFAAVAITIVIIAFVCLYYISQREGQAQNDQQVEKQLKYLQEGRAKQTELFEELKNNQDPTWSDIVDAIEIGFNFYPRTMYKIIAQANIMDVIEVSNIKKQLYWNQNSLRSALDAIDSVFEKSFDDQILTQLIEQFKNIHQLCGYEGYNTLLKSIGSYSHIAKHVQLKPKALSQDQLS